MRAQKKVSDKPKRELKKRAKDLSVEREEAAPVEPPTQLVPSALSVGLTSEEANFVYNVEVLDLPVKLAASQAGVSAAIALRANIIQARENMRRALRDTVAITKEDVINGYREAIHDAKIIVDPTAQIRGWSEISELLGFKKVQVEINVNASVEVVRKQVREISDEDLIKRLGAEGIIDGEFYRVGE